MEHTTPIILNCQKSTSSNRDALNIIQVLGETVPVAKQIMEIIPAILSLQRKSLPYFLFFCTLHCFLRGSRRFGLLF
jgi:hypothetical protein